MKFAAMLPSNGICPSAAQYAIVGRCPYVFASMQLIHKFSVYDCLLYPPLAVDGSLLHPDLSCQRQTSHWLEKLHYAGLTRHREAVRQHPREGTMDLTLC